MFWLWLIFIALLFALFFCGYELFYCIHKHLSEQNQYSDEQKERNVAHKESYIAPVVEKRHKTYSPRDIIQKLRNMHPKNFEEFIELLFCLSGYNTVYKSQRVKRYGKWYARKD